jgi:hypothetical protein
MSIMPLDSVAAVSEVARCNAMAGCSQFLQWVPPEGGRQAADSLGVEHVQLALPAAQQSCVIEQVGPRGGGHDRAGVVNDPVCQPAGLAGARGG